MELRDETGRVCITEIGNGRRELIAEPAEPGSSVLSCLTDYPLELIQEIWLHHRTGYVAEEIQREQDENDAPLDVRYSVEAYFPDEFFARPIKILDFGCGGGASAVTLSRLFPNAAIIGMDIYPRNVKIATLRAKHHGADNVQIKLVSHAAEFEETGFDAVFLNAVYEHMYPAERVLAMPALIRALKPGGVLFLNQTPHRWFPIEAHTSRLPLVNYLPDRIAHWATNHFSRQSSGHDSWAEMLRGGIRGGSIHEIMRHVRKVDSGAKLLRPIRVANSWAGIWYAAKRKRTESGWLAKAIMLTERFVSFTRLPLTPYLNIAVTRSTE